jgi:hypothetical protein
MKNTFIYLVSLLLLGLASCTEDFNKDVAPPQSYEQEEAKNATFQAALGSGLSAPLVLSELDENASIQAVSISAPALPEGATLSYALEISKTEDFAQFVSLPSTSDAGAAMVSVADLDAAVKALFGKAAKPNSFYIRTYVYIHEASSAVRSTANITGPAIVTPIAPAGAALLYVPGNHQGWTPPTAPTLYSEKMDMVYEGYVYLDGDYKFTSAQDWEHDNYGDGGNGTLDTDPAAGNLNAAPGFYYLKADLNAMTYQQTLTVWGIIGDATAGGWDTSTPMTYDRASNTWTVSTQLEGGKELKFRANNDWTLNMGGTPNQLVQGGDNIKIEKSGGYLITLSLSNALSHSCTITEYVVD